MSDLPPDLTEQEKNMIDGGYFNYRYTDPLAWYGESPAEYGKRIVLWRRKQAKNE